MQQYLAIFFFFLPLEIFANQISLDIANALKKASLQSGIDKKMLYTLAKIESEFNPHIIAFVSKKKFNITKESKREIHIKNIPYKDKYIVQIRTDKETLKHLASQLIRQGFSVDMGLMQINSSNVSQKELEHIFDLDFNLAKSTYILKSCIKQKTYLRESIEYYNKGLRKVTNYDYYKKFKRSFIKDFANIKN
ncbi:invasion protein IagB [Helicobacter fennelliae]|uniref:Invasion protein IagB n=1 Tax=Helicobacter fennelliae TaxID=215 RepID=A0A2X3EIX2_9HELI|nr:transglycosylase SLT domain-containing protein [Helicobacter fennelliae]SQC36443.1 invasion protein IagB [Helicobacter fennelliae]